MNKILLAIAVTVFTGVLVTPSLAQDSPQTMLQAGRKQAKLAVGKQDEAKEEILGKAIEIYDLVGHRWPEARNARAEAALRTAGLHDRMKDPAAAMTSVDQSIELGGANRTRADAFLLKGRLEKKARKTDAAVAAWTRVGEELASERRRFAEAQNRIASALIQAGRFSGVEAAARRVLDDLPELWRENVEASNLILRGLIARREWVKALDSLKALDKLLTTRFGSHEKWVRVRKAMDRMSARKTLTPIPSS